MISKEILKQIIREQAEDRDKDLNGVTRQALKKVEQYINIPQVIVIRGVRRAGKSTFLRQIRRHFYKNEGYYLSFEDERLLNFTIEDFNLLYETFIELYGEKQIFFLDEIQNIAQWELFVRRMHDKGYKFFLTGSNASMLSKELGTRLTGRALYLDIFPFSFIEYFIYKHFNEEPTFITQYKGNYTTKTLALLSKHFKDYLKIGGFPEHLRFSTGEILNRLYEDILYRDIIVRNEVNAVKELRELGLYLFSNIAAPISFNKLKGILSLGSVNTVKKFIQYFEDSYLIFTVNRYSYSIKQQTLGNKKIYAIDNGMINHIGFKFSDNTGHLLENLVFIELNRRQLDIFYYKTNNNLEVDFVIRTGTKITSLIQVCQSLFDKETRAREIKSLLEAMKELKLDNGLILTMDEMDDIKIDDKEIKVMPIYRWLLEEF